MQINSHKQKQYSRSRLRSYCLFTILFSLSFYSFSQKNKQVKMDPSYSQQYDKARAFINSEDFISAIAEYAPLAKKYPGNTTLAAEYAYALALAGVYEAAIIQLDRIHNIGLEAPEVNYFIVQTFALMDNSDLANEFWFPLQKYTPPSWISAKAYSFQQKYKRKKAPSSKRSKEELIETFKSANELAAQNKYFQSIARFQEIITDYPNNYLPYIGYGMVLENSGAIYKALRVTEKAITLVGNDSEQKQLLEERLSTLKSKIANTTNYKSLTTLPEKTATGDNNAQMSAFIGGMYGAQITNINLGIGYYVTNSGNFSFNCGMNRYGGETSVTNYNAGISAYARSKGTMVGVGLLGVFDDAGNSDLVYKFSLGASSKPKSSQSSFDIFFDVRKGFKASTPFVFTMSIGTSIYFGKRK
jgi:tetratricopeptide (TPR) repeat protein